MLSIEISNRQSSLPVDEARLKRVVEAILRDAGVRESQLSIAIVDDATIHGLNRQYLEHDYPTDVLSFVLEREGSRLEGEVIVSADTATRAAAELAWPAADELLLYVIHGMLHLVGMDDATPQLRAAMHEREHAYLALVGLQPPEESEP